LAYSQPTQRPESEHDSGIRADSTQRRSSSSNCFRRDRHPS